MRSPDTSWPTEADLPARFGRYTLQHLLGSGGVGRVFQAEMQGAAGFRKQVALKLVTTPERVGDLVREARVAGSLRHHNIVDTYDLCDHEGRLYITMELVDGPSLRALLTRFGALPPGAVLDAGQQICAGLAHAHSRPGGLVHRDLKPANLLIHSTGHLKIADFGLAASPSACVGGRLCGTPQYMSPEQLGRRSVDARSDVFSLGLILYELLTGSSLIQSPGWSALRSALAEIDGTTQTSAFIHQVEARLPGGAALLRACLRRNPNQRISSCAALEDALARLEQAHKDPTSLLALVRSFGRQVPPPPLRPERVSCLLSQATIPDGAPPPSDDAQRAGHWLPPRPPSARRPVADQQDPAVRFRWAFTRTDTADPWRSAPIAQETCIT